VLLINTIILSIQMVQSTSCGRRLRLAVAPVPERFRSRLLLFFGKRLLLVD
jgi:hypothetical protein